MTALDVALRVPLVGDVQASNVIALFALVISAIALLRPWWNERRASIEVRFEQYRKIRGDRVGTEHRYVVKNHGPAEVRDLEVTFYREGEPVKLHLGGLNHGTTTPLLHPGEELHMNYAIMMGERVPEKVVVAWRDGRRFRRQRQEYYPASREL
jgi:hypothetical protein